MEDKFIDPVLHAHLVGPNLQQKYEKYEDLLCERIFYDISGRFDPASIRDQIVRAVLIVERAIEEKVISKDRPLLIIGGGFSGVAAAYQATKRHQIPTVQVELGEQWLGKFRRLIGARFVCPTQYDFPSEHWRQGYYPLDQNSAEMMVKIGRRSASGLVDDFMKYVDELSQNPLYSGLLGITAEVLQVKSPTEENQRFAIAQVEYRRAQNNDLVTFTDVSTEFGMVLSCVGFGGENTVIDNFMGVPFWYASHSTVPYQRADPPKNVLLCGSGDGSLQDFLLIITGKKSAREIYDALKLPGRVGPTVQARIWQAEEQALRRAMWAGKQGKPSSKTIERNCETFRRLHQEYEKIVVELMNNEHEFAEELRSNIEGLVGWFLEKNTISIAYKCNHFTKCYPFNRFLVLLIDAFIREKKKYKYKPVLLPKTAVCKVEVEPNDEMRSKEYKYDKNLSNEVNIERALNCLNQNHKVWHKKAECRTTSEEFDALEGEILQNSWNDNPFNQVFVHYGIISAKFPFEGKLPPYYCMQFLPHF